MLRGLKDHEGLDINLAGDFLVMAATLMEIKSATLLPKPPPDPNAAETSAAAELADPRYELVQKLLEYKRFKDAAAMLDRQHETHQQRFPRYPAKRGAEGDEPPPIDLEEVQVWDLLAAFTKLMQEVGQRAPRFHEVVYDDTPIDLHAADIEDRLKREGRLSFRQLVEGRKSRSEMIGVFLALLEMIRQKRIIIARGEQENDIEIDAAPEAHRKTYQADVVVSDEAPAPTPMPNDEIPAVEMPNDETPNV